MKLVDAICEAGEAQGARKGAIFFDTSRQGFIKEEGIHSTADTLTKACDDFITSWCHLMPTQRAQSIRSHKPPFVVNQLILQHGLVMLSFAPKQGQELAMEARPARYIVAGVDGILDHQDLLNFARAGKLKPETPVRVIGQGRFKPASQLVPGFFQDMPGGGQLATSTAGLAAELAKPEAATQHFVYFSANHLPPFTAKQVQAAMSFLLPSDQDIFHWSRQLTAELSSSTILTAKLLKARKR